MGVRLASLNDLKDALKIGHGDATIDTFLIKKLEAVGDDLENFCNINFTKTAYSLEKHRGGRDKITVKNWPIVEGEPVTVWDFDGNSLAQLDESDYDVDYDAGIITLLGGLVFSEGDSGAQVSYTGGYPVIGEGDDQYVDIGAGPSDSACMLAAARYRRSRGLISADDLATEEASTYSSFEPFRGSF